MKNFSLNMAGFMLYFMVLYILSVFCGDDIILTFVCVLGYISLTPFIFCFISDVYYKLKKQL